ncbi:hypothetical protein [Arthrobacter sp.]|uniref:hypothetical protein n=1 Tax=Arthrobacter sp. TaxID=1667 RepID=UPI0033970BE1
MARTILQKAVTPALGLSYLANSSDTVAGYVLRASDVIGAGTPELLFDAHGLGFPGSPWRRESETIDVIRFQSPIGDYLHDAVAPEFVDREPFTGTGFTSWDGGQAPLFYLDEVRLPAGAELWRIGANGSEDLLGVYVDVARGWAVVADEARVEPKPVPPSSLLGWRATWRGAEFVADVVDDGNTVVLSSPGEPPADVYGFEKTPRGVWRAKVPLADISDIYELNVSCTFNGLEFRVIDAATDGTRRLFRLSYTGHNADFAEGLQLEKADAGVYRTVAAEDDVQDLQFVQHRLAGLPGAGR